MTTIDVTLDPPNPLTDSQATFNSKALAFTQALTPWSAQVNLVAGEVAADALSATNSSNTATTQAGISTTQAGIATTKASEAAASAIDANNYIASLPDGSINDAIVSATTAYSSEKAVATFAQYGLAGTWTSAQTFQSALIETPVVANTGTAYTVTDRTMHDLTLTGNCTLTFPAMAPGKQFSLLLTQDGTGSRTVTFPSSTRTAGGVAFVPTATAGKTDSVSFLCDGTYWLMFVGAQNFTRA